MQLVSIITPCYNSAKYIAQSIYSVINQSYSNWELLIIDDGSTDDTISIVKKIALSDSRIHLIQLTKNQGSGVARDAALNLAKGSYIAFLDADDVWKPNKLEKQLTFMKENNLPLTFSFYELIDEVSNSLSVIVTSPKMITYKQLFFCNWVGNLTGIYSVDFFGKVPISSIKKRQDWILWLTLVKKAGSITPTPLNLAYYRVRKDSLSASKWKLIKYNFLVYRDFHQQNIFKATISLVQFLVTQFFIKPKYKIRK